jgi:hypothetical protein
VRGFEGSAFSIEVLGQSISFPCPGYDGWEKAKAMTMYTRKTDPRQYTQNPLEPAPYPTMIGPVIIKPSLVEITYGYIGNWFVSYDNRKYHSDVSREVKVKPLS